MEDRELLEKILLSDNVVDSINENLAFIFEIIPKLKASYNFEHKHPHHDLDVLNHTIKVVSFTEPDVEVRLAALLHDIGKPFSFTEGTVRHFYGHAETSEKIANEILTNLGYDEKTIKDVCYLIKYHDTIIDTKIPYSKNEIILIYKRLSLQYADAKSHASKYVQKRLDKLDKIKEELDNLYINLI